jgi:tRNA A-37 threonylcarbamoyl transferase component Bud32
MVQDRDAGEGGRRRPDGLAPSDSVEDPAASDDSLLRAAAHVDEPPLSTVRAYAAGAPRVHLAAGAVIAKRYHLERELGRGGMGVVWEATHLVTRRRVAIKCLLGPPYREARRHERFLREARAASAVPHPNVVEILDLFELEDGTPVMVMERLAGETLRTKIDRDGRMSLETAASILLPVARAVATAHSLGVVHRDLKPENIFLTKGPAGEEGVKVLDFGVAKLLSSDDDEPGTDTLTNSGAILGTPCYMAPEQAAGDKDIDERVDIWALGVIAYECLAGERPLSGSGVGQVVMRLMTAGIKPIDQVVPGLPSPTASVVMRMLSVARGDRPRLHEVEEVFAASMAGGRTTPGTGRSARFAALIAVAAAGTIATAITGWRLASDRSPATAQRPPGDEPAAPPALAPAAPAPAGLDVVGVAVTADPSQASAAPVALPSPTVRPALDPKVGRPSPTAAATVAARAPRAAPAAPVAPAADCDPPYEFDGHGRKTWKRECL